MSGHSTSGYGSSSGEGEAHSPTLHRTGDRYLIRSS
jgi:hypothetical protein